MYKSNLIQQKYNNNDNTKSDNIDIVMNLLLNGNNKDKNHTKLLDEVDKLSEDIIKTSLQNNYALKDKDFVENHLEIKTCIESLINETKRNIQSFRR